jgi:hypothetical protein
LEQLCRRIAAAAVLIVAVVAQPAFAAPTRFAGTGMVTRVVGLVPATGSVELGDALTFGFGFDPAGGIPSLQVFATPFSDIAVSIGDFTLTPGSNTGQPTGIVFGTGFRVFPGEFVSQPVLNQNFAIPGLPTGNLPFATGSSGRVNFLLMSTFREDLMGATPTLANLRNPTEAAINRFQLAVNDGARTIGFIEGDFTGGFTASVPEPSAWVLLILGFGAIGGALRSRPRARAAFAV